MTLTLYQAVFISGDTDLVSVSDVDFHNKGTNRRIFQKRRREVGGVELWRVVVDILNRHRNHSFCRLQGVVYLGGLSLMFTNKMSLCALCEVKSKLSDGKYQKAANSFF